MWTVGEGWTLFAKVLFGTVATGGIVYLTVSQNKEYIMTKLYKKADENKNLEERCKDIRAKIDSMWVNNPTVV
jgi:hypothetical protein